MYGAGNNLENRDAYDYRIEAWPELGGDDKIYGGNDVGALQTLVGGPYNDKIYTGHEVTGNILVYGDKMDTANGGNQALIDLDATANMMPLVEFPETFNKYDGNDLIEVGDDNGALVTVYGQGGNDKIIGGVGANQTDKLFGGSGDDRIWMINPN